MRQPDQARRDELVARTLDYLAERGLAEFSLRGLAAELGTSARMLVHYFGTRENLLDQAFAEHRARAIAAVQAARGDKAAARTGWDTMADPANRGHYVVMFHLLAAGLTDGPFTEIARHAVADWLDVVTGLLADRDEPSVDATVLVSGLKGILLDLLVTGDRDRCAAAAHRLIGLLT
ncbi:Transcriptional regulator, TetR family [Alloactinosynnema sp. L-07]|uniref:TetR/AcrR family transcriptional regulator n=1 Tax=Alloactinosynnema sp. L-07 TaxID=1653480 RepID=UPI00065EF294|nr:TetR/AcrR family transcriptional regulator [Alloactinosynnema sp. L-07]CRK60487.1 Transcriptional regulator, TetR family [Alloactinosynnema sp. L-07]